MSVCPDTAASLREISATLVEWYGRNRRELPWRETRDPYRIWISEVILQQTRVAQGLGYYLRFTGRFPDPAALAAAPEDEVLRLWQGLGYYSRARNLHAAARRIVREHGGRFPRTYPEVRALPGVGDYTAAAICSIAFGLPHATVDGNVYRVLSRLFDLALPVDEGRGRRAFASLAAELLDPRQPGMHNQALMEFGALHCVPSSPECIACPLAGRCLALAAGTVGERPVKRAKSTPIPRYFNYLHILWRGRTILSRRGAGDIWNGLYEFPLIETGSPAGWDEVIRTPRFGEWFPGREEFRLLGATRMPPHQLSHRTIHACVWRLEIPGKELPAPLRAFVLTEGPGPGERAVPRLLDRYFETLG